MGSLRLRSRKRAVASPGVAESLRDVSLAAFPPSAVPEVKFDRLNEHYRSVATLARLVLRHGAFEAGRGKVRAPGFLMDMNQVFQEFVTVGLRECLELSEHSFRSDNRLSGEYLVHLDEAGRVVSSPTSPGGTAGSAPSWAMRSTSGRRTSGYRTQTCTRCWPMPRRWTCPADFWSMLRETPKAGLPRWTIGSAMQESTSTSSRSNLAGPIPCLEGELHALAAKVRGLRQTTQRSQTAKAARMAQVAHRR